MSAAACAGLPPQIARFREPVLLRVLSHLPDELLSALALGLERHAGRLVSGQLYGEPDGGGCAVGVMLRELRPGAYEEGRLRFWLRRRRHRSVLSEQVDFEPALVIRLSHVEMCFDRTTTELCEQAPEVDVDTAANTTGRWMAEECREELRSRAEAGTTGFFVPCEWQDGTAAPAPQPELPGAVDWPACVQPELAAAP